MENEVYKAVQRVGIVVDKDKLIMALRFDRDQYNIGYKDGMKAALRHGYWIDDGDSKYICSECGNGVYRWSGKYDYCPNCGADMDGEDEE